MEKIFIYIFFGLFLHIYHSEKIISFPFKRILGDKDNFHDNYFDNNIYINFKVGTPAKEIRMQIKSKHYPLCIRNDTVYDYNTSSTYKTIDNKDQTVFNTFFQSVRKSNESFELGEEKTVVEDLEFLLTKESKFKFDGVLGLQILEANAIFLGYNLIPQLKQKDIITKESFFFLFDKNSDNGTFIIGEYPHFINSYKDIYHEQQFQVTNSFIPKNEQNFDFQFMSVIWNGTRLQTLVVAQMQVELGLIIASNKFADASWNFFAPHFENKKCSRVTVRVLYDSFICEDYEGFNITSFPSIQFYISNEDYHFELTYEDLFVKKDGKVYFMVCFNKNGDETSWRLGNIFLKKNMLVFDMDRKIMGFYNKSIDYNKDNKSQSSNNKMFDQNLKYLIVIVIIAFVVIIGLVIFIVYKFCYKKRGKRAYELADDDYNYETSNNLNAEIVN